MTATAWGVVVAAAALVLGGITVPLYVRHRNAMDSRRQSLEPAYDQVTQSINRIRSKAEKTSQGFAFGIDDEWHSDVRRVKETKEGRWPTSDPTSEVQSLCAQVEMSTQFMEYSMEDHHRFLEQFESDFEHAVNSAINRKSLGRSISKEGQAFVQRQHLGRVLMDSAATSLPSLADSEPSTSSEAIGEGRASSSSALTLVKGLGATVDLPQS